MDSGNSDSSSCGEDQEYDSRAAAASYSFSSFMNHPVPPPFDPFSNFLQLQNNSPLDPNVFWPRNTDLRSNPYPNNSNINFPFTSPPQPPAAVVSGNNLTDAPPASAAMNDGTQNRNPGARNTKKRSRASRRAPTTVLTTDTSNFRAMVQEFTGIPAPPFTSSSPFQRSRFDLYGGSSSMRLKSHDAAQPQYLHRPFSSEIQPTPPPQPFLTSAASISSSSTNSAASTATLLMNYQSLSTQSSNIFNLISNPNLTSFLQTDHRFPFSSSILSSKNQGSFGIPSNELHSNIKTVGFDEFSLRHGNVSATIGNLPNLVSSDQIQPRNDHNNDNIINQNNNPDEIDRDRAETTNVSGSHNFSRNPSVGKMNYLADSSTDFRDEKGQGNIATRSSEGMMESWICSSELK